MPSNSENYAVKLLVKCRQTIRNTETRNKSPKTMKHSYSKSELATMAGVSYSTFYRYLKTRRSRFDQLGLSIYAKKLPLSVVKDICDDYCFDTAGQSRCAMLPSYDFFLNPPKKYYGNNWLSYIIMFFVNLVVFEYFRNTKRYILGIQIKNGLIKNAKCK